MGDETKSVTIHGVTIKKGDIVKIKFNKLEDILQDARKHTRVGNLLDHYGIDTHTVSFCQGKGHFIVKDLGSDGELHLSDGSGVGRRKKGVTASGQKVLEEIRVEDYNAPHASDWSLNEVMIKEISVENDVAESYFSEDHQLSLVLIDSVLYVNGAPLTAADSKIYEMFEKVLAEAAITRALTLDVGNEKIDDDFL